MAKERTAALAGRAKEAEPEATRGIKNVKRHVVLRTKPGETKLAWDLAENSMAEIMTKARQLCEQYNKKWPRDVIAMD